MKKQSEVKIPLHILIDAIEMANDEWNQYLDIEEMQVVSLPEYPFAGEYAGFPGEFYTGKGSVSQIQGFCPPIWHGTEMV